MTERTLEQALDDLAMDHDYKSVSVGISYTNAGTPYYRAEVHWDGFSRRGFNCVCNYGDNIQEAINKAIDEVKTDRTRPTPAPVLPAWPDTMTEKEKYEASAHLRGADQ